MLVNLKGGKWYKLLGGNLINFDTSLEIVCVGTKVIVSYSSLDRNQPRGKAYCENAALNYVINGGKRFGSEPPTIKIAGFLGLVSHCPLHYQAIPVVPTV